MGIVHKRNGTRILIPFSLCKLLGIVKSRTSPYCHQDDGQVERFNRTLLDMLATSAKDHPCSWEHHLRKVALHPTRVYTPRLGSPLSICSLGDRLSYLWTLSSQPKRVWSNLSILFISRSPGGCIWAWSEVHGNAVATSWPATWQLELSRELVWLH